MRLFCFILLSDVALVLTKISSKDEHTVYGFSLANYVKQMGYTMEVHQDIQTEDGYLLEMQRIVPQKTRKSEENGQKLVDDNVILLMHGLGASAEIWFLNGKNDSLPFILADLGFDVWIGNARGTTHSKKHVKLNAETDSDYWDYSFHELGLYDIPACLSYIINITKVEKLIYVGHSQGGGSMIVASSLRPEINSKIKLNVALAPATFAGFEGLALPHEMLSPVFEVIDMVLSLVGVTELSGNLRQMACEQMLLQEEICHATLFGVYLIAGLDVDQLNDQILSMMFKTSPDSSSLKQYMHYNQLIWTASFKHYDYGPRENMKKYNNFVPPDYNVSRVAMPTALFYGTADKLVTPYNAKRLAKLLPNLVMEKQLPLETFTHMDFVGAKNIRELLYNDLVELIVKFSKHS